MPLVVVNSKKNNFEIDYSLFDITKPCLLPPHLFSVDDDEKNTKEQPLQKPLIKIYNESTFDKISNVVVPSLDNTKNKISIERTNNTLNQHRYSLITAIDDDNDNLLNDDRTIKCCYDENEYCKGGDVNNVDDNELNEGDDAGNKPLLLKHPHSNTSGHHHYHHHHFHQRHRNHHSSGFT